MRIIAALLLTAVALHAGDNITVFMYSEYIDPALPGEFTKRTGIGVTIDVYEAQEEMLAKLQAGGAGQYDVLIASDVTIAQLTALALLQPLDKAKLANAANLWPRFADPAYDRGNRYTLPYLWGTVGLAYRRDAIVGEPSWAILFDPVRAVGPFIFMDEQRSMLGLALLYAGKPVNSVQPADLAAAAALLATAKADRRCLGFENGVAGLRRVSAGEAAAAVVYNGDAVREMEENKDLLFAIPREGAIIAVDNLCIAAKAPNVAGAHAFIDFLYEPAIAARNADTMRYGTPNLAALPLIAPSNRANPAIYPSEAQMDHLHELVDLGGDTRLYDETWAAIKAR